MTSSPNLKDLSLTVLARDVKFLFHNFITITFN